MVREGDKKGFRLVELLIVTVVVVSLMGIVFRLTGIVGGTTKRQQTISRMQRLENCLAGYYAVFGSYPPVPLQGSSRNVYLKAMGNGVQSENETETRLSWTAVRAACKAQPVRAMYPAARGQGDSYQKFQDGVNKYYEAGGYTKDVKATVDGWRNATLVDLSKSSGYLKGCEDDTSFKRVQLFRYGLMAYLLPRYKFMLECVRDENSGRYRSGGFAPWGYAQWTYYNTVPPRMDSGTPFANWESFCDNVLGENEWQIELIPSQAACARWVHNLVATADDPNIVSGQRIDVFGVEVGNGRTIPSIAYPSSFELFDKGGYSASGSGSGSGYPLYFITVQDGWDKDFYYYSPAPYQSYVLWSSGPDTRTFPPWVDLKSLSSDDFKTAIDWMADDIKGMGIGKRKNE